MFLKKYFAGLSVIMIIFTNNPQVLADNVEIFGEDFENKTPPATVETPAETKPAETFEPPAETPSATAETPAETKPTETFEPPAETPSATVETPAETKPTETFEPPVETPPATAETPAETKPTETFNPPVETPSNEVVIEEPFKTQPTSTVEEKISPAKNSNSDEEDFGDSLNFNDLNRPSVYESPEESSVTNSPSSNTPVRNTSSSKIISTNSTNSSTSSKNTQKMKNLPQRFFQVAVDENYIYYLDKQSVAWKKIPYLNSEYMADVWVRMIERNPNTDNMPQDLANYINDVNTDEISLAHAKGFQYTADDLKVLRHKKYFLEHYYLRPKKEQIQFLCELEVVGHPQNTTSQRKYDVGNWEELVPGSMESILYYSIIQIIGKSKASERGHMTFFDMVEEYARISVR